MAKEAVTKALEDAGVPYDAIEAAVRLLRGYVQTIYNLQTKSCILSMFTVTFGIKAATNQLLTLISFTTTYVTSKDKTQERLDCWNPARKFMLQHSEP